MVRGSRSAFINTPFERGGTGHEGRVNRFKRFTFGTARAGTPLKRGVNEIELHNVSNYVDN